MQKSTSAQTELLYIRLADFAGKKKIPKFFKKKIFFRIYFSDRLYSEDELPAEFKLYLPVQQESETAEA